MPYAPPQEKAEVEIYSCGCRIRSYAVDHAEAGNDLPPKPALVSEFQPCRKHRNSRSIPPEGARLVMLRGEPEAFLNE